MEIIEIPNWDFTVFEDRDALRSTAESMFTFLSTEMGLKKTMLYPAMEKTQTPYHSINAYRGGEIELGWLILHGN